MLTIKFIEDQPDEVIRRLSIKQFDAKNIIPQILELNKERKELQTKTDTYQAEINALSKEIGNLMKSGKQEEAHAAKTKTSDLKDKNKELNQQSAEVEKKLYELLVQLPNIPHASVKQGAGSQDNETIRSGGKMPDVAPNALPHWDICKKYSLCDFELGNKISGSGFPVYLDKGARLHRALINYFLQEAIKEGYREIMPPLLVNEASGFGTGQLPDKDGQMYFAGADSLYLIPTAEVPLTNIYRDMILDESELPVKLTAYTPCFRREAGSYGKEVRGLNRLHQFDKIEIVEIQKPEDSYHALERMVSYVEKLIISLELPYRIQKLCGGDMGFTSSMTYDFEVFSSAQGIWLEVSSVSNFETFQSNRLKLRYRDKTSKKNIPVHTLNGSALALPRIVASLLENNQSPEGIRIPEVLRGFTGFEIICNDSKY